MSHVVDHEAIAKYEHESWSRCADSYLDTFAELTTKMMPMVIEAADITSDSRVLDLACGPGNSTAAIASRGASVVGIDFAETMLTQARRNFPEIEFIEGNIESLPFTSTSFDAVVCNFTVHHLARPTRVFKEVHRVLKPGGHFSFAVWGAVEDQTSIGVFFNAYAANADFDELPHGPLFGVIDQDVFESFIVESGLRNYQQSFHKVTWETETMNPLIRAYSDWSDMASLPDETQNKIVVAMRENAQPFRTANGYEFPHIMLLGSAVK